MRNLNASFTMRKDGTLPRGDWFKVVNKAGEDPKVYIYDEIGFWGTAASEFVTQINEIDAKAFELHLNSPGGEIFDGLAIFNAIKQHKATVTVYVDGLAASAASFIAQAGDKVVMARNAQMMIHDGIAVCYGNEEAMRETADLLSKISDNIADIYAYAAGKRGFDTTLAQFRNFMREEVWYTGAEAVENGLADEVSDADDEEAEKAKNTWDLTFYNHAGRERAESPSRIAARLLVTNNEEETDPMKSTPKASTDPATDPAPVDPPADPAGDPAPADPPAADPAPADPPADPAPAPAAGTPENKVQGVLIDGKMVTDWSTIQNHFNSLNAAQAEQRTTFREDFVKNLAKEGKILAAQMDSLVTLVNGDGDQVPAMSDEQFAAFSASYGSVEASGLFAQHGGTSTGDPQVPSNTGGPMTAEQRADRISILQGTVAMLQRTMSQDKVENTPSYKELQTLLQPSNES